ncbi:MFS transporter [Aldersonia sp. NBC_00410]|uniref:MFS transporter n=1 Tax=Aldersonia sp. NBC_00410 TaxID=2975954 RepID=UPI002253B9DB|nr:MFS transporter [Aldersonia sp. NBC_00410]MCX5042537.1 MFS transporter [Aldersonia sp. NBC_00410]
MARRRHRRVARVPRLRTQVRPHNSDRGADSAEVADLDNRPAARDKRELRHVKSPAMVHGQLRSARISAAVAFAVQGFFLAVVLTQLPQIRDRYGFGEGLVVGVVVLISLLAGVGSVVAERIALKRSSRVTLRAGLALIAVTGLGIALAPGPIALFIALAGYGIALGIVDASTNMQAVAIQHGYGTIILSSFYAAWSAGAIVGALYVSVCSAINVSLQVSVVIAAILVAIVGAGAGRYLLEARTGAPTPLGHTVVAIPTRIFVALGVAMALFFAIDLAIGNWSALYLDDVLSADAATAALGLAAYQGAALLSRLTGDLWVRRFGEVAVIRGGGALGVLGMLIVVLAPNPAVAIAGFLVVGLGVPLVAPLCFSTLGHLTSGPGLDAAVARLNIFNYAGTLIGGGVVGAIAVGTSLRVGFVVPLIFAGLLIMLAPVFAAQQRTRVDSASINHG